MLAAQPDIGPPQASFELCMGEPILAVIVFGLAMAHGWLWSMDERRKAVQEAYDQIRDEIRRERRAFGR
jgi:hypothetical protein